MKPANNLREIVKGQVIHLPGTCPSESAFLTEAHGGIVLSGDVMVNGSKGLAFLPQEVSCSCSNRSRME